MNSNSGFNFHGTSSRSELVLFQPPLVGGAEKLFDAKIPAVSRPSRSLLGLDGIMTKCHCLRHRLPS